MFHVVQNQMNSYIATFPDVMAYVISALISYAHVETAANTSIYILYPRLYEELKTIMWHGIFLYMHVSSINYIYLIRTLSVIFYYYYRFYSLLQSFISPLITEYRWRFSHYIDSSFNLEISRRINQIVRVMVLRTLGLKLWNIGQILNQILLKI